MTLLICPCGGKEWQLSLPDDTLHIRCSDCMRHYTITVTPGAEWHAPQEPLMPKHSGMVFRGSNE